MWKRRRLTAKRYSGDNRLILPKSPYRRRGLAPRCRLVASWGWSRSQGSGCSPVKAVRELGLERRETVRSLSVVGVGDLGAAPLKSPTPTTDRDRTVSRRSKPSSRTALTGEQPDPWDLLQPQDATSRHRGAKPCRRYGLLGAISLLSPGYLLAVERRPYHLLPPDH